MCIYKNSYEHLVFNKIKVKLVFLYIYFHEVEFDFLNGLV